ncbi:VOC family protein [Uliginosibacterium sp. H1]|uniref:VOC family protein n=1 Tax=Uliginosibacterium sp. H1 TaxID=3114757 RepID=UPI002E19E4B1|nr:VOC family protein [Uliginosibacterium sp. H1]
MSSTPQLNAVNWFEIPVSDLGRAQQFYQTLLARPLERMNFAGTDMVYISFSQEGIGGALVTDQNRPSLDGTTVYLNANPELDPVLARVAAAGGKLLTPRTELPENMGVFAVIQDSEGNRVGLHADR